MRINVVAYDPEDKESPFYPVLVSQSTDENLPLVNVLLLGNDQSSHFVLIKSLDALLRKPNTRNQMKHCIR